MLLVTLSSIPPRFSSLSSTLRTLLAQTVKADRILLYIPWRYRRFPDWDGVPPDVPAGVEIRRCAQDYGPATKVLPAAFEFRGQDCRILFCDDDKLYQKDWIQRFQKESREHPGCCIASAGMDAFRWSPGGRERALQPRPVRRWRLTDLGFQLRYLVQDLRAGGNKELPEPPRKVFKRPGFVDIFEGFGGVLVRPEFFEFSDGDIPPKMWAVDDVWLSGMLARKNIPIWLMANILEPQETEIHLGAAALHTSIVDGINRDEANALTVDYLRQAYKIWL